jgi:hypothetical protein
MENSGRQLTEPTKCGHCGNKTPMGLIADFKESNEKDSGVSEVVNWKLLFCPVCRNVVLLYSEWLEGGWVNYDEPDYEVLYPAWVSPILGLPDEIDEAYQAACEVKNINSNAFGVLIGRVIDEVCLDRGATGKTFYERLESLAESGEIPERLCDIAHNLRKLRNIGAHADLGNLTEAEVPVLDDLCRAILEYVYAAPKLIEQVELRLEELRNRIEEEEEDTEEMEADDEIPF